ncbi:MAG: protein kinase, partial [Lysobacter sp.]
SDDAESNPVFTVSDGLLRLSQSVDRNSMVRKLQIAKMRGQATVPGLHSFRISGQGIRVFPPAQVGCVSPRLLPAGGRARLGVDGLDDMLGGGLPRGYSLLMAGPSGSGKSIAAAAFLAEGARLGERGLIASFEQRPEERRSPQVAALIESGNVVLVETAAPDLSIDEILALLMEQIALTGATRLVIDSLSGFELRIAPTYRADFRESMLRMVTALSATGVTMLMTSELEDRYTDLRFSPYGTAFLTDAIIVQRYIEVESRLRRVLAVVKVRAHAHSNELREYTIDADGLHVGETLTGYEGQLGGQPTRRDTPCDTAVPAHTSGQLEQR